MTSPSLKNTNHSAWLSDTEGPIPATIAALFRAEDLGGEAVRGSPAQPSLRNELRLRLPPAVLMRLSMALPVIGETRHGASLHVLGRK